MHLPVEGSHWWNCLISGDIQGVSQESRKQSRTCLITCFSKPRKLRANQDLSQVKTSPNLFLFFYCSHDGSYFSLYMHMYIVIYAYIPIHECAYIYMCMCLSKQFQTVQTSASSQSGQFKTQPISIVGKISYNAKSILKHLYLWGLLRKDGFAFHKDLCKAQSIRPIYGRDPAWIAFYHGMSQWTFSFSKCK